MTKKNIRDSAIDLIRNSALYLEITLSWFPCHSFDYNLNNGSCPFHEREKVYPEIECTCEKATEQMNFEVTQLKFIRYDRTFFVRRMTPSYHNFMLHGYALR